MGKPMRESPTALHMFGSTRSIAYFGVSFITVPPTLLAQ
jgi:hypothetical protein